MQISVPVDEIVSLGNIGYLSRNINNLTGLTDKLRGYVRVGSLDIYSHYVVLVLLGFGRHVTLKVCSFRRTWR